MMSEDRLTPQQRAMAEEIAKALMTYGKRLQYMEQMNIPTSPQLIDRPQVNGMVTVPTNHGCVTDDGDEYDGYNTDSDDEVESISAIAYDKHGDAVHVEVLPPARLNKETREQYSQRVSEHNKKPFKTGETVEATSEMFDTLGRFIDSVLPEKKYEAQQKAAKKQDSVIYLKDSYIGSDGKPVNYKRVGMKVDWSFDDKDTPDAKLEKLSKYVTKAVAEQFGGFGRIKSLVVIDNKMIINGVCFMPAITGSKEGFPLDSVDYITNGCIAPFFKWEYLGRMYSLYELSFDSQTFALQSVGDCIDRRDAVTDITFFNICKRLEVLTLGDYTITRTELNSKEGKNSDKRKRFKKDSTAKRRWNGIMDGFTLDVYKGTNAVQKYTVGNVCEYATHRGNKGLLRFTGGVLVRGALATAGVAVNASTHLIGGIIKGVKNIYKDATTPVDD